MKKLIDKLKTEQILTREEFRKLLSGYSSDDFEYIRKLANETAKSVFSNKIYLRGLIEFSNYCKNDCYYCGLRRSNKKVERYRLSKEDILSCCESGFKLGFRTFVLQSGEDPFFTDEKMGDIILSIKTKYPSCALTLSIGERNENEYELFRKMGADRFLLRHETAEKMHYEKLHPSDMSFENRINCLKTLKKIGFQTGAGFMVGSPCQTIDNLINDLFFIHELKPEMVGVGPFLPHSDTPFGEKEKGSEEMTLLLISILRLMSPHQLIPATTALGTIDEQGREKGIMHGANVLMPNLSPANAKKNYLLYDNKVYQGDESAKNIALLSEKVEKIGYKLVFERGDYADTIS